MLTDAQVMSIDELKAFLASSNGRSRGTLGKKPMFGLSAPCAPMAISLAPESFPHQVHPGRSAVIS